MDKWTMVIGQKNKYSQSLTCFNSSVLLFYSALLLKYVTSTLSWYMNSWNKSIILHFIWWLTQTDSLTVSISRLFLTVWTGIARGSFLRSVPPQSSKRSRPIISKYNTSCLGQDQSNSIFKSVKIDEPTYCVNSKFLKLVINRFKNIDQKCFAINHSTKYTFTVLHQLPHFFMWQQLWALKT